MVTSRHTSNALFYSITIITGDAKDCCSKFADVLKNKEKFVKILMVCCGLFVWLGLPLLPSSIASQTSKIIAVLCVTISKRSLM